MSTSTVSFTAANNALARRRPVVVGEERRSIKDLVGGGDVTATSGGKEDLSRSMRGDLAMEASRDVMQVKKSLQTSPSALPSRRSSRKPKTERSRWVTVARVLTKHLSILIILIGLVQMVQKLALRSANVSNPSTTPTDYSSEDISVFKQRLLELEESVKASAKSTEGKVEVVNQKLESEIGGLMVEMNKKLEEKDLKLTAELKKLDGRTSNLEDSLVKFTAKEWLAKEEFDIFFDEYRKASGLDNSNSHLNLDDMRAFAREFVRDEITKHAADGLGKVDYALASGGGFVMKHSEIYNLGKRTNWFYDSSQNKVHPDADRMLRPSFGEPGQCFALKGNSGFVDVGLRTAIVVEAVTLEHVSKSVAYDRSSAPKDCKVTGWLREGNNHNNGEEKKIHFLTEFTYDLEKSNAQTYEVLELAGSNIVDTIRLEFTSNHGSQAHTCIYRLRVHGHEPSPAIMVTAQ